jgi:hypothetical protein
MTGEELAFFDAVAANAANRYDEKFLCDLVRDVVQAVKQNLKIEWTKPHREDVKAGVRASKATATSYRARGFARFCLVAGASFEADAGVSGFGKSPPAERPIST